MQENKPQEQEDEINLLEYVVVILKHKEFIIKTTLAAMVLAAVISLVIPPTYQAETRILPPQSGGSGMAAMMMAQMGGLGGLASSGMGVKSTNALYMALLKTRPVEDYVIDKFNLMAAYKLKSREKARKRLADNLVVANDMKSGIITVSFKARKPQQAADIANAYVEGLQNINNNLAITDAAQRRLFFEEQLNKAKDALVASEDALRNFQQRTGTIKLDDEAKAAAETIAQMRAQVTAREVQISAMRAYATPDNPDLLRLQDQALALRGELAKMESRNRGGNSDGPLSSVGNISSLGTQYLRRMRDFKYNESLYEILTKQFEAAKLDESRDAALIQMLERAEVPEKRAKPQRRKIVMGTGALVFVFSIFFVILRAAFRNYFENPDNKTDSTRLKELLDFSRLAHDLKIDMMLNKARSVLKRYKK